MGYHIGITIPTVRNVFSRHRAVDTRSIASMPTRSPAAITSARAAASSSQTLPYRDPPVETYKEQKVSGLDIRELADLIRQRYALDTLIWAERDCMPTDRDLVLIDMVRADAIMEEIMNTVQLWDNNLLWESRDDWLKLQMIKERLEENKWRWWTGYPPWADLHD